MMDSNNYKIDQMHKIKIESLIINDKTKTKTIVLNIFENF